MPITKALTPVNNKDSLSNNAAFFLGFACIESFEAGFNPRVIAGKSSTTIFINNICKATKGKGMPMSRLKNIKIISPITQANW